jgi:hypothetical protein
VGVGVGAGTGVGVGAGVGAGVGVGAGLGVGTGVGVAAGVGAGVDGAVGDGPPPPQAANIASATKTYGRPKGSLLPTFSREPDRGFGPSYSWFAAS